MRAFADKYHQVQALYQEDAEGEIRKEEGDAEKGNRWVINKELTQDKVKREIVYVSNKERKRG